MLYKRVLYLVNTLLNNSFALVDKLYPNAPRVYMFHDLTLDNVSSSDLYTVSVSNFENFILNQIQKSNIAISLSEIIVKDEHNKNTFAITFDDVYDNVFHYAYPILKKHKIPFAIFVSVSLLNKEGYLSTKQLELLSKDNMCTIGSHGIDHIFYRDLNTDELNIQFNGSKETLMKLTGKEIFAFAFPYGSFYACSIKSIAKLTKTEYKLGFSTIPVSLKTKFITGKYFLPRINVTNKYIVSKLSNE